MLVVPATVLERLNCPLNSIQDCVKPVGLKPLNDELHRYALINSKISGKHGHEVREPWNE